MANIFYINTPGNIFHLNVTGGELAVALGAANTTQQWQLNEVNGVGNNVFTIQHVTDGHFIQIHPDAISLNANPGPNCQLTLDNGIGNHTTISNNNLNPAVLLQLVGHAVEPNVEGGGQIWSFVGVNDM